MSNMNSEPSDNGVTCFQLRDEIQFMLESGRIYEFYEEANPGTGYADTTATPWYAGIYDFDTGLLGVNRAWTDGYQPPGTSSEREYRITVAHEAAHRLGVGLNDDQDAEDFAKRCMAMI